jgi:hypothetical protein
MSGVFKDAAVSGGVSPERRKPIMRLASLHCIATGAIACSNAVV